MKTFDTHRVSASHLLRNIGVKLLIISSRYDPVNAPGPYLINGYYYLDPKDQNID